MGETNVWKLQDAKARFSEVVRRARTGEPQEVTVHGKQAVLVIDPARFEVSPKPAPTMADFIKRTRAYKFDVDIEFDRPLPMDFPGPRVPGSRRRRR